MKINVPFRENILPKRFGKEAKSEDVIQDNPVRSFPFEIKELPAGARYVAITLIDYDAVPICSFPWIHWLVTDIDVVNSEVVIPENFSLDYKATIKQGKNSFSSPFLETDYTEIDSIFVGPTPPDKDHRYTLEVFALSAKTDLKNGFYYNELLDAVRPIALSKVSVNVVGQL
ncbi:TPA: YbhB/YbcL family Raf kinase inhibitor-like protein [Streptococcus suis]|nr:YbhB/YbcL family Raf kinase inhibitor-like protein [Streptococcus suis]